MENKEKAILVAIDGSVYSSNSLDYLITIFSGDNKLQVHLLSVVQRTDSSQNWMLDVDPLRNESPAVEKKQMLARRNLEDAKKRLIRNGFTEQQIHISVKITPADIASLIHQEALSNQYDSILLGRRGVGTVGELFFGSTSSLLIEKCHRIPLWIIDGEVHANRFLLAVQSQPESLMAADHLAWILKEHPDAQICLYHSNTFFGNKTAAKPEAFHSTWGREWCDTYLDLENFLFYAHAQVLLDNGIAKNRISQLPVQMHIDVGFDLLRQAQKYHCGTIVLGRRGPDVDKGLLKGVSERTMQQAQDIAVWLVG